MDYYHTDDQNMVEWLAAVFEQAVTYGRKVRIRTEGTRMQIKIGEGVWTYPFDSTPDPYRDLRTERPTVIPTQTLPNSHQGVIDDCIAAAWRNFENGDQDTQSPADVAADIAQYLIDAFGIITYPRERI